MSDRYILSIDPGLSSGIALGFASETEPYSLIKVWQFGGGAKALAEWIEDWKNRRTLNGPLPDAINHTICEKFTPLQNAGFNLTLDSVEPLRGEGVLLALGVMPDHPDPTWRRPANMYKYGGKSLPEKKKRAYQFLKDNGMHLTGKTVGCPDAFDARSATLHGIAYAIDVLEHKPTFDLVSSWVEGQG